MAPRLGNAVGRVGGRVPRWRSGFGGLGECPVCGKKVKRRQRPVKAWAGTYAHGDCASFVPRSRRHRLRLRSQRVYERFTAR